MKLPSWKPSPSPLQLSCGPPPGALSPHGTPWGPILTAPTQACERLSASPWPLAHCAGLEARVSSATFTPPASGTTPGTELTVVQHSVGVAVDVPKVLGPGLGLSCPSAPSHSATSSSRGMSVSERPWRPREGAGLAFSGGLGKAASGEGGSDGTGCTSHPGGPLKTFSQRQQRELQKCPKRNVQPVTRPHLTVVKNKTAQQFIPKSR